jgi:hypothetical protein
MRSVITFYSINEKLPLVIQCLSDKNNLANRFPGIQGMANKDYYSRIMKMGAAIRPEVMSFEPNQFLFPQDQEHF